MPVAACLIVKDGAASLARCLASVSGLVDEIVVYDTGSTDDSIAIARSGGALVVEGSWGEDFAQARNAALTGVSTDWVLSIDADEFVDAADPSRLRAFLDDLDAAGAARAGGAGGGTGPVGVLAVQRRDLMATAAASYQFVTPRLFRRVGATWTGRVHEVVEVCRPDGRATRTGICPPDLLSLVHDGYADPATARAKAQRNATIGLAELAQLRAEPGTPPHRLARCLLDLGRSLVAAGDESSAVHAFDAVRLLVPGSEQWARASDHLARVRLCGGEFDAACALSDELRAWGAQESYCDWLLAQALAQTGEPARAAQLLDNVGELTDPGGRSYDPALVTEFRDLARALAATVTA